MTRSPFVLAFLALAGAVSSAQPTQWRPIVAVAFDGSYAPHRLRYDTAYFTGGYQMRVGVERRLTDRASLRLVGAGTWQEGNTGTCMDSAPPICESPVHALRSTATGVLRLRTLELEAGGGWSGLTRKHSVTGSAQWPLNGPIAYGSASLGTPRIFGVRGFIEMRYGAWLSPRRTRDFNGGSAGLEWRPR
jgi:hypothetical protein